MASHKISAYRHTSNENPSHPILAKNNDCDLDTSNKKIKLYIIPINGGASTLETFTYSGASNGFNDTTLKISGSFTISGNDITNGEIHRTHPKDGYVGDEIDTGTFSAVHNY